MSYWIDVRERMPQEIGDYLVYVKSSYDQGMCWAEVHTFEDGAFQSYYPVTHWMLLPAPPIKESK